MTEQTVVHLPRAVLSCPRALTAEDIAWAFGSTLSVLANEEQGIFLVDHPLLAVVFKEVSPEPRIDGGAATPTSSARSYEVVECNYSGPAGLRQALEFLAVSTGGVLEIDGESINAAGAAYDLAESAWFVAHADNPHEVVFVDEQGIHLRDKDGTAISPSDVGAIAGWKKTPEAQQAVMDANARAFDIGEQVNAHDDASRTVENPNKGADLVIACGFVLVCAALIGGAQWLQSAGWETAALIVVAVVAIIVFLAYVVAASAARPRAFRAFYWGAAVSAPVVLGGLVTLLNMGYVDQILLIAVTVFVLYLMVFGLWLIMFRRQNMMMLRARRAVRRWLTYRPDALAVPVVVAGAFPEVGGALKAHAICVLVIMNDRIVVAPTNAKHALLFDIATVQCEAWLDAVPLDLRGRRDLLDMLMAGTPDALIVRDPQTLSAIAVAPIDPESHMVTHAGLAGFAPIIGRLQTIGVAVRGILRRR